MLAFQALAGGHHVGRANVRVARRDGVKATALPVVVLDQSLAVAIEVLGADAIAGRRQAVDTGEASDQPQVAPRGLVE